MPSSFAWSTCVLLTTMSNDVHVTSYAVEICLFYLKTNPCLMKCVKNNFIYLFHVFCLLLRYLCYNFVKLTRFVDGDVINITLMLCLLKLCILLSGDVLMNPGPTHGDVLNKSISILHHNIRSLRNKIQYIANIVDEFYWNAFGPQLFRWRHISPCFNTNPFRLDRNCHGKYKHQYAPGSTNRRDRSNVAWNKNRSRYNSA